MAFVPFTAPDVLVLGAGGVLGEAWMSGMLAGIEDAAGLDLRRVERFVGTSAGAIVAAGLVAGRPPRRPPADGQEPDAPAARAAGGLAAAAGAAARAISDYARVAGAPLASLVTSAAAPGGALARAAVLAGVPRSRGRPDALRERIAALGARFDGRLRVCVVDRRRGRRVVLGAPGAPAADVADAVAASCALPWRSAPVEIDGREYVDGGVWSPTNIDAAPAGRGTLVLCLTPTGGAAWPPAALDALRVAARTAAEIEAAALRRHGARVRVVGPDRAALAVIGPDYMDPARVERVLAAGYRQGRGVAASPTAKMSA